MTIDQAKNIHPQSFPCDVRVAGHLMGLRYHRGRALILMIHKDAGLLVDITRCRVLVEGVQWAFGQTIIAIGCLEGSPVRIFAK